MASQPNPTPHQRFTPPRQPSGALLRIRRVSTRLRGHQDEAARQRSCIGLIQGRVELVCKLKRGIRIGLAFLAAGRVRSKTDGCYVVGPEHAAVVAEKDDAVSSAVVGRMRNVLITRKLLPASVLRQKSTPPTTTRSAFVGSPTVVPALIPKISCRVAILVQPVALDETLAAVYAVSGAAHA